MKEAKGELETEFTETLVKIDQLLRYYRIAKRTDKSEKLREKVRNKCFSMIDKIKYSSHYAKVQNQILNLISSSIENIAEPKKIALNRPKPPALEVFQINSSMSNVSKRSQESQIQNKSDYLIFTEIESVASHEQFIFVKDDSPKKQNKSPDKIKVIKQMRSEEVDVIMKQQKSEEVSDDKGTEANSFETMLENLISFCQSHRKNITEYIIFNEDIFTQIKEGEDCVYLFGTNNPDSKKTKKIIICTLMKFTTSEVMTEMSFNKELKQFKNNIRSPLGLIIKGESEHAIRSNHLKFLLRMESPFPIIYVLKNVEDLDGWLIGFETKLLNDIKNASKIELLDLDKQVHQWCSENMNEICSYNISNEQKVVVTKFLQRSLVVYSEAEQAPHAISIDNEGGCIKQQKNVFPYKTCFKFHNLSKNDFSIYYIQENILTFKTSFKEKDFQWFKRQVMQSPPTKTFILSTGVVKDTNKIRKQFFEILLSCKIRDPHVFISLSTISFKKTAIIRLKEEVTYEMLQKYTPIQYKDLQRETEISYCINIIHKSNWKEFECEEKVEIKETKPFFE